MVHLYCRYYYYYSILFCSRAGAAMAGAVNRLWLIVDTNQSFVCDKER